ncbi:MAG TPA: hypothetical protein VMT35_04435 [Ignavibacteriaceae bacterium]|nr:hypothetical protein [Ignavibacteriaceae bacterium]
MNYPIKVFSIYFLIALAFAACDRKKGVTDNNQQADFSGVYCLNEMNLEMTIVQSGNDITFKLQTDVGLFNGTGTIAGDTIKLSAAVSDAETFKCPIVFSQDRQSFSGTYQTIDTTGAITGEGIMQATKGECPKYDIAANGIPKFVVKDFTQLSKIEKISKFRSGAGHDYSDSYESCRSMKHYYSVYDSFRHNNTDEIYSPVNGSINSISPDGHGASIGLNNKQIQIRPHDQPAFIIRIFHCDLISSDIAAGKEVQAGELLGYGRLYYDDIDEYGDNFDIAVWVNTPSGMRLVSYFDTMNDSVFSNYISRGAHSRQDFIITKEERDSDTLNCSGETFLNNGNLENWFILH